ncbi:MAG: 2-C-methyl-D-erythritol 4-phosphate cytidylyltransferase [bacterium]|nr:2-C-methyl-D-erythritol 4-phosphate cytidylyltransferase [bacterium]
MAMPVYSSKFYAIIVAAGKSVRYGEQLPKQFQPLLGKPVFEWSLQVFQEIDEIDEMVLVLPESDIQSWEEYIYNKYSKVKKVIAGGETRFQSVRNGIQYIKETDSYVLIHDAARAGITKEIITSVIQKVKEAKVVLPLLDIVDTLKQVEGDQVIHTLPRTKIKCAQTPQAFYLPILLDCMEKATDQEISITDEIQLIEKYSQQIVTYVEGSVRNLKITTKEDLEILSKLLSPSKNSIYRSGIGYDIHPFSSGRKLILGGVEIPHPYGLHGHSDADVLCHAIADAILGAAAFGDIGIHFPNTDEKYQDVSSIWILSEVGKMIRQNGFEIVHIDSTLILETPKILPYREQMIQNLSQALSLPSSSISLKATTNETLGAIGRKEGAAAFAIATLRYYD